jgi:hypothetical protein
VTLFCISAICFQTAHEAKAARGLATDAGIFANDSAAIFASLNDPLRAESFVLPIKVK